ncbi:S8 family serine peptidase [Paraburkholderia sediminicola]|uniref:S8 family serine peptidase n=1 Tax=Paraburkholderia sediminicola TaxID=458836 RepID=UPI0038B72FF4
MKNVQKKRQENRRERSRKISAIRPRWCKVKAGRVFASTACISLALAACGGNSGDDAAVPTLPIAEGVAAPDAASSGEVSLNQKALVSISGLQTTESNDRFIVKYRSGTSELASKDTVQPRLDRRTSGFIVKAKHLRRLGIGADVIASDRKLNAKDAEAFMRNIAADPDVEYVEVDTPMQVNMVPNDTDYDRMQWAYTPSTATRTFIGGIRAEGAWDISNGSGVVIAMLDNGVTSHSDLDSNILPGYDFTAGNRGGNGSNLGTTTEACPVTWHGTHVAGILAAATNNSKGIAGTAWGAKVVPVRVLNGCGSGLMSDVADGIAWASGGAVDGVPTNAFPAKVLNLSLGGNGTCSFTYQNAINDAVKRGASVVVASGNNNLNAEFYQPGNCMNVIVVAGHNANGNRGADANYGPVVDISAPGENIWSTWNYGTASPSVGDAYSYLTGTSMATPFVSGVIALAQAAAPKPLTPGEMRALIMQNARAFPVGQLDQPIGAGMLDATATVAAAKSGKIPAAADFTCREAPNLMQLTCSDNSSSRGASIVSRTWTFGDGTVWTVPDAHQPYHNYEYAGNYDISLTLTDTTGAVSTLTRMVPVRPPPITELVRNVAVQISAAAYELQYYALTVPDGAKGLTLTLSGGSGTATMYARRDSPTTTHSLCEATIANGSSNTCSFATPQAGTYYIVVNASTKVTGISLVGSYAQ